MNTLSELEKVWKIEPTTRKLELDSFRFTAPEGFIFTLYKVELIPALVVLGCTEVNEIQFSDNTRVVKTDKNVPHLRVVDTDPWINAGYKHGDYICDVDPFIRAIGKLVQAHWPTN